MTRFRFALAFLVASCLAPSAPAADYQVPWKDVLPKHEHAVFEAQVDAILPAREGQSPKRVWVRLKVIRLHQGKARRTYEARFTLVGSFGPTDAASLERRREELGLVPGKRILVVVTPLDAEGTSWVGSSLGDPQGKELARSEGDESGVSAEDYVRGHIDPSRLHEPPRPPEADGNAAGNAFGQ